jgi:hypothetical protein
MAASRFEEVTDKQISKIKLNSVPKNTKDLCKNTKRLIRLRLGDYHGIFTSTLSWWILWLTHPPPWAYPGHLTPCSIPRVGNLTFWTAVRVGHLTTSHKTWGIWPFKYTRLRQSAPLECFFLTFLRRSTW